MYYSYTCHTVLYSLHNYYTSLYICRVLCRAKLIPFLHELKYDLKATNVINQAFDDAPSALPSLLHLGSKLSDMEPNSLQSVMGKIQEAIPTLDTRILMEYTITLASALVVGYKLPFPKSKVFFSASKNVVGITWCKR